SCSPPREAGEAVERNPMTGTADFCAWSGSDHASITEAMTDISPSRLIDHSHSYATPSTQDGPNPIQRLGSQHRPVDESALWMNRWSRPHRCPSLDLVRRRSEAWHPLSDPVLRKKVVSARASQLSRSGKLCEVLLHLRPSLSRCPETVYVVLQ